MMYLFFFYSSQSWGFVCWVGFFFHWVLGFFLWHLLQQSSKSKFNQKLGWSFFVGAGLVGFGFTGLGFF